MLKGNRELAHDVIFPLDTPETLVRHYPGTDKSCKFSDGTEADMHRILTENHIIVESFIFYLKIVRMIKG